MNKQQKQAAIYLRLSRDDGGDAESNSIGNQRELLRKFAKETGIPVKNEYVDDGISGTTFEREGFKRMISDIEDGKIGVVICKDLSRLGRNNALVAYYTEIFFVENGIRFIAVNDGIDSAKGDNEIMGFRSVINEFYARDISKKTRSTFQTMALKGKFIGAHAPYGYSVDPEDRHHLVPDENTAPIVQEMFKMAADGMKPYHITLHLSNRKIVTPRVHIAQKTGKYMNAINKEFPTEWNLTTVVSILKNQEYCGHIISQKETTQSFKSKKVIHRPKEEWVIARNMHTALVDEQTFDKVQSLIKTKKRENVAKIDNIFAGLIKCSSCGYGLSYTSPTQRNVTGYYNCNLYRQRSRNKFCTSHYITFRYLYAIVFEHLKKLISFVESHKTDLEAFYSQYLHQGTDLNNRAKSRELEKHRKRANELDAIIKKIVEQNALGTLTDERFAVLSKEYEVEQRDLSEKIENLQTSLNQKKDSLQSAENFLTAIGKYTNVTELTAPILHELIEKIVVHQGVGVGKARTQEVDIYWRFVGLIPDK
ncbi:MAG: recombinase family protein [Defluviitaleaceae bacterium]|nr:recombinase family protein [Defluviitaleaceae bacterium]